MRWQRIKTWAFRAVVTVMVAWVFVAPVLILNGVIHP